MKWTINVKFQRALRSIVEQLNSTFFNPGKRGTGEIYFLLTVMANVYKNIQAVITSSASDDTMYTSPDATTSIIKTLKIYNIHGSSLVVTTSVYDLSSTTLFKYDTSTC